MGAEGVINHRNNDYLCAPSQAYRYLDRYKAIDFIDKHYGIAHTQRFEDVISDITAYCQRFGGAIK